MLPNPLAIHRFLDAATSSLTIDSQFGGMTGLFDLEQSLSGIPASRIALFTLPNYPGADVVPSDTPARASASAEAVPPGSCGRPLSRD